jgi:hypothetical protein
MDRVKDAMVAGNRKGVETAAEHTGVVACRGEESHEGHGGQRRSQNVSAYRRVGVSAMQAGRDALLRDPALCVLTAFSLLQCDFAFRPRGHWPFLSSLDVQARIARERVPQMQRLEPSLTTPLRRYADTLCHLL